MYIKNTVLFKRFFDLILSSALILLLSALILLISVIIKFTSSGNIIYWSERIGRHEKPFLMPKFRTMKRDTPAVATHLLGDIEQHLTLPGKFLRKTSLDELPQLYSIFKGDMSFVGPRPALYNQDDLILLRRKKNVHLLIPGLTGLAQINGRDNLPIIRKVELDAEYLENKSFLLDLKIIFLTIFKTLMVQDISH